MKHLLLLLILVSLPSWSQIIEEDFGGTPPLMEEDSMPVTQSYQMTDAEMLPQQETEVSAFEDPNREYTYEEIPEGYQE